MKTKKPKTPKPRPVLSREEVVGLCKRLLKDGSYHPIDSTMVMYKLLKQYPNDRFWRAFDLDFKLNSLFWLLGKDGQERLASDWAVFSLDMPAQPDYKLEDGKVGEDVKIDTKPKTIAELLKP